MSVSSSRAATALVKLTGMLGEAKQYEFERDVYTGIRNLYRDIMTKVDRKIAEGRRRIPSRFIPPEIWTTWDRAKQAAYRAETMQLIFAKIGGDAEYHTALLCKEAGLPYPISRAVFTAHGKKPDSYEDAVAYRDIMGQLETSDTAEVKRVAYRANVDACIPEELVFSHMNKMVMLLKDIGFECTIAITLEMKQELGCPCCGDDDMYEQMTSTLTVSLPGAMPGSMSKA